MSDEQIRIEGNGCGTDGGDSNAFLLKKLLSSRTILLSGAVGSEMARNITNQLLLLEGDDAEAPITLLLNSPGGSVTDGFAIYDTIRFVTPKVRIVCAGLVASMGTVIVAAVPKKDRYALPNTRFMIHQPHIPASVYGPASDLEITANEILKTREHINKLLAKATGRTLKKVSADTQRDYWMTAQEAKTYGLVGKVIEKRSQF